MEECQRKEIHGSQVRKNFEKQGNRIDNMPKKFPCSMFQFRPRNRRARRPANCAYLVGSWLRRSSVIERTPARQQNEQTGRLLKWHDQSNAYCARSGNVSSTVTNQTRISRSSMRRLSMDLLEFVRHIVLHILSDFWASCVISYSAINWTLPHFHDLVIFVKVFCTDLPRYMYPATDSPPDGYETMNIASSNVIILLSDF